MSTPPPDSPTDVRERLSSVVPPAPVRVHSPTPSILQTPRLTLRPLHPGDAAEFIRVVRDSREHLDRWAPLHRDQESDEALFHRQLELAARTERDRSGFRRLGVLRDGRIAGSFNLNAISRGLEMKADVSAWLGVESTARGLATEALTALIDYAFADPPDGLGLHLLEAGIRRANLPSIRLASRLGFTRLAEERSRLRTGDEWAIHDIYQRRAPIA